MRHLSSCFALFTAGTALAAEQLVLNPDFEQAAPANASQPAHWDKPDGLGI